MIRDWLVLALGALVGAALLIVEGHAAGPGADRAMRSEVAHPGRAPIADPRRAASVTAFGAITIGMTLSD